MSGTAPDTFDSFLSRGIGPKQGMWRVPLPLQSYEHPSVPLSAERLLNLFSESQPANARNQEALISTGGLILDAIGALSGPIITMNADLPGILYILAQDAGLTNAYRVTFPIGPPVIQLLGTFTSIAYGAGNPSTIMETIAVGVNAVVVCIPPNAWTCSHTAVLLEPIGGTGWIGASSVAYLDGYFVFTAVDQVSEFFVCLLLDPTMFAALDFAFGDAVPNVMRRAWTVNREIWLAGEGGIEVWYDGGGVGFPLLRQTGGFIVPGVVSVRSCAVSIDNLGHQTFWWVGMNGKVYRSSGYTAVPVSTRAIEKKIANLAGNISCAVIFSESGHDFYAITIGSTTLVYDMVEQKWANRSSTFDGSGAWLPFCTARVGQTQLYGSGLADASIYHSDPLGTSDAASILLRQATLPPLYSRTSRESDNRLEIEMDAGGSVASGDITLSWSNDGGNTYNTPRVIAALGSPTPPNHRFVATRLGSFRQRVYRIAFRGTGTIYAVDVDRGQPMQGG
jgi:hypothetical protein